MNVIGLEVSTSAAKCILFSLEEGIIDAVSFKYGGEISNTRTTRPEGMLLAAKRALKRIVENNSNRKISAIGLGGAWHSLLLLDKERLPLGPIYTWADVTGGEIVHAIREDRELTQGIYYRTGCMVHAMYPVWQYYHLRKTNPQIVKETRHISSQVEYLFEHLTGDIAVSKCIASASGFFNIHTLDWDSDLLDLVQLDRDCFADLKDGVHFAGLRVSVAEELGLPSGIPVTVGYADGAMNQVGVGGDRDGIMSFSVGTSAAIRMICDRPIIPDVPSTWCYYLYGGKRLVGAATQGACNCVDWFLNNVSRTVGDYGLLEQAALKTDVEGAPYFLPFIYGERCPGWQDQRLGGFADIRPTHGLGDLYFAVLEGILFNVYQCYRLLTQTAWEPDAILISGGIMNSPLWLQMAADIFGKALMTTGFKDDSAVGMAILALKAAGKLSIDEGFLPPVAEATGPPSKNSELHRRRFERYLELYQDPKKARP